MNFHSTPPEPVFSASTSLMCRAASVSGVRRFLTPSFHRFTFFFCIIRVKSSQTAADWWLIEALLSAAESMCEPLHEWAKDRKEEHVLESQRRLKPVNYVLFNNSKTTALPCLGCQDGEISRWGQAACYHTLLSRPTSQYLIVWLSWIPVKIFMLLRGFALVSFHFFTFCNISSWETVLFTSWFLERKKNHKVVMFSCSCSSEDDL